MGLPFPLHRSCSGSKAGGFLLAITAKYVKNFGQFQHLTQETSKSCSFLTRGGEKKQKKKKTGDTNKNDNKSDSFQTIFFSSKKEGNWCYIPLHTTTK